MASRSSWRSASSWGERAVSGFVPAEETEDGLLYELTAAEYSDLLGRLEQEGLTVAGAATAEEAAAAGGAMVLVVPS